ncbi:DUF2269 domain-containing protein [Streptomyces albipurpureus]|uniref:DUF2269 domain-containing protein n=1 Tax=Streptomyces albipurpureus TaxID=2897419 RepID=A0ABT0USC8_9ACTN|nr:DUF2269 domain-containing protein [Streptomyces sp. CWNU-1]MCM2391458.1 DUF2269 domain-containing protein [Streptomyces sp. CWNU-1]
MKPLKRPTRRAVLVLHVSAASCWLGLTLGLLALALAAITTESTVITKSSIRSMKVFTDWLVLPLALLTLASGLVLALGTAWGLLRHRWVLTKFCLTMATTAASVFALRPGVNDAATAISFGDPLADSADLVTGPIVSFSAYLFMTVISVVKPWGLTRRGRRMRKSGTSRKALDERSPRQTA